MRSHSENAAQARKNFNKFQWFWWGLRDARNHFACEVIFEIVKGASGEASRSAGARDGL
jgi:hypothetical protein